MVVRSSSSLVRWVSLTHSSNAHPAPRKMAAALPWNDGRVPAALRRQLLQSSGYHGGSGYLMRPDTAQP